jgi:toxin YoeB
MYRIVLTSQAVRDAKKIERSGLKPKVMELIGIIENDPFSFPPAFEILHGDFKGLISRRINRQHRLVYEVFEEARIIKIYRMWTHYE